MTEAAIASTAILESVLTCLGVRRCDAGKDAHGLLSVFHECTACGTLMRPKAGDCCVFCSYGSVKCPYVQSTGRCCRDGQSQRTGNETLRFDSFWTYYRQYGRFGLRGFRRRRSSYPLSWL